ncbi:hypothetical protein HELRODRAFT_86432, partial [Helobdella robusta]|uniref:Homeobox domain-containing protein n=1 Tax=Helobdella robusta TaxID=6412 RepID=T1G6C1_HELRO
MLNDSKDSKIENKNEECVIRTDDFHRKCNRNEIREVLEREFNQKKYINVRDRDRIACETGLSNRQIKFWFQNRRAKIKK